MQNKSKEVVEVKQVRHNEFCFCESKKLKFSTKQNHVGVGVNSKYCYIDVEADEKDNVQKFGSCLTEQALWIIYKSNYHTLFKAIMTLDVESHKTYN